MMSINLNYEIEKYLVAILAKENTTSSEEIYQEDPKAIASTTMEFWEKAV
jgi:hypothetical protein